MSTRVSGTPQPLFDQLARLKSRFETRRSIHLFLDFDGTLAPICDDPGAASMPEPARKALRTLSRGRKFTVAVISGRALPDLRERVRLEGLTFAGNHGLEIVAPGLHFVEPGAASRVETLEELSRHLSVRLRPISGAEVENKVLTASVHFRRAPEHRDEIRRTVEIAVAPLQNLFQITEGEQVFEVRPRVNWNKGTAVRWILEASEKREALSVYVGDDATDEDAFLALPDGITVRVGEASGTAARYWIPRQESVQEFLTWLSELKDVMVAGG